MVNSIQAEPDTPAISATSGVVEPVDSSWEIGAWTFRPLLHRLSRDSRHVRLEPKVSDLLLFLAQRARRPVSKDAILEGVWDQKFLGDSALTRTMAELRRALGDDARTPIYVETIPKLGYRLIADVRRLEDPVPPVPASNSDPVESLAEVGRAGNGWRFVPWVAAGLLLIVSASLVAVPTFRPTTGAAPEALDAALKPALNPALNQATADAPKLVAVLPLEDLSLEQSPPALPPGDDDSRNFFAAGMTEALVAHLAQTGAVGVISRHSVDLLLAEDGSILDRARSLGIDALVEGTVQRAGDRVRITVRLTELDGSAERPTYSWIETYERDLRDILTLQAEVSRAIAGEVRLALGGAPPAGAGSGVPGLIDPRAYELYLQARHAFDGSSHKNVDRAAELFAQSIAIDPDYASAHAGLARLFAKAAEFGSTVSGFSESQLWREAITESEIAISLDEASTEAYAVRGMVEVLFRWDWLAAERNLRRALELNPSDAYVRQRYAFFLTFQGRFDEAIHEVERAADLDPLSAQTYQALAHVYFHAGRYDKVHEVLGRGRQLDAQDLGSLDGYDTWALALEGRHDEALGRLEERSRKESMRKMGQTSRAIYGWVLADAGHRDKTIELRSRLLEEETVDSFAMAILETGLGNHDAAFASLERALDERSATVPYLKVEPFLAPLRHDPRFDSMVSRLGL